MLEPGFECSRRLFQPNDLTKLVKHHAIGPRTSSKEEVLWCEEGSETIIHQYLFDPSLKCKLVPECEDILRTVQSEQVNSFAHYPYYKISP